MAVSENSVIAEARNRAEGAGRLSLGLCVGAASIKAVELERCEGGLDVGRVEVFSHGCNVRDCLAKILERFPLDAYDYVCMTGRKFKGLTNLPTITEPEATELALRFVASASDQPCDALLSLGAENFICYELDQDGSIADVRTGGKCASGTGDFFLQQIRRMDLPLEEAVRVTAASEPYHVSGRCSVFCKSDCTHALNKGIARESVCAGLGNMVAEKAVEILGANPARRVIAVGGVTRNGYVMGRLRLAVGELLIPEMADVFEALGAAVYALREKTPAPRRLRLAAPSARLSSLRPLREGQPLVTFWEHEPAAPAEGDRVALGLDVGSTTTKAVLMRLGDCRTVASVYLRTLGDPVGASRRCYREIERLLGGVEVEIAGLGVTGSGRHISALHAETEAVINEIIAHASAAAFFDTEVDTILEIGGQDAKYTYLVNGVPCDYAMNEACSAGTGSFLEEAARESLGIDVHEIQEIALQAAAPPNFSDQCAAFIGSDIRSASHEISRENIVAGLVYSICMNYNNRVRGPRKVGRKVFMQGGVCYNRAVPLAMALLLQRPIVVPPEPGLMGAFGAALEVKQRLQAGTLQPGDFQLARLAERQVEYEGSFICRGGSEKCDRGCSINRLRLDGRKFCFGGICNKYYNQLQKIHIDQAPFDLVEKRQQALYASRGGEPPQGAKSVAISRSFLSQLLLPFYRRFFEELGFRVILSEGIVPGGLRRACASFCYPAQISHGMMADLIGRRPDYVFLPRNHELHVEGLADPKPGHQCPCIMVQAESSYLRSAFPELQAEILSPALNWSAGWSRGKPAVVELADQLGVSRERAGAAFDRALADLTAFFEQRRQIGEEALRALAEHPERIGIVLFGRPYNAFAAEANMGIPKKFASRGVFCIPFDSLPFHHLPSMDNMNWASGHDLIRAARFVKDHPQLFGAYVTNFACGPDSFLVGYFRDIMRTKPSLTLEIDSHTADAGVNTRVEAFLEIVDRYRRLGLCDAPPAPFRPARLEPRKGRPVMITSDGRTLRLTDPRVKIVFPSMGRTLSEMASAMFRGFGMRAQTVPLPGARVLALGRANTSGKECLPLILTTGSLIDYVENHRDDSEATLYFMPTTDGSCRFPQYSVFLNKLIEKRQIRDAATLTLSSQSNYGGLGIWKSLVLLEGIVIADAMDDARNTLLALACNREEALHLFDREWQSVLECVASGRRGLKARLRHVADRLRTIPLRQPVRQAKRVLLAGEIFVRRDEFCSQRVVEMLAARGIVVQRAAVLEWIRYVDYWVRDGVGASLSAAERIALELRIRAVHRIEKQIKRIMARSGLVSEEPCEVEQILRIGEHFVDRGYAGGETVLVIGRFFHEILRDFDGLISIGPFACLPTRVIDAILSQESQTRGNRRLDLLPGGARLKTAGKLAFLSVETDGNAFPQILDAKIEAFCLQVERQYRRFRGAGHSTPEQTGSTIEEAWAGER